MYRGLGGMWKAHPVSRYLAEVSLLAAIDRVLSVLERFAAFIASVGTEKTCYADRTNSQQGGDAHDVHSTVY